MELHRPILPSFYLLALCALCAAGFAPDSVPGRLPDSSGTCTAHAGGSPDKACNSTKESFPDEGLEQNVWLLQTSMGTFDASPAHLNQAGSLDQGDVYDYIQEMIDERAATEALHMAEQAEASMVIEGINFNLANKTAASLSGISANGVGDLKVLFHNLLVNGVVIAICLVYFGVARHVNPLVLAFRDPDGRSEGFFGWARASLRLTLTEIKDLAGFDQMMLIEFTHMAMKMMLVIGIPFLAILSPLDWCCGGNAAGQDHLSWMGLANVQQGNWVCWFHAPAVWWVIGVSEFFIFRTMTRVFIPRHTDWLMRMDRLRATTVLVENLPEDKATVAGLTAYFDEFVFDRKVVKTVEIVKDTSDLMPLIKERESLTSSLHKKTPAKNEAEIVRRLSEVEDKIARLTVQVEGNEAFNTSSAFVTFLQRREATVAMKLLSPDDEEELTVTEAPGVVDVMWVDLQKDPNAVAVREIIGYGLIVGLAFGFLPLVVGIAVITDLNNLAKWFPFVDTIVKKMPAFATIWEGVFGAAALSLVMSFVPTILEYIGHYCFIQKATTQIQHYIQIYYFYFQVVFVLLVTAIGSSLFTILQDLIRSPMSVFSLLAKTMPVSTHFYMNFFIVQYSSHFMNLTRYPEAMTFFVYSRIYESLEAKELTEPEEQGFFGIGSRSSRWSLLLVMGLVFSTLSPLMCVFALINFGVARAVYGYLVDFAETKKPELGGVYFATQIRHTQQGLFIYVALMTGVLLQRAKTVAPGIISACAFVPLMYAYYKWKKLHWETLEFAEVQEYDMRLKNGEVPDIAGPGSPNEDLTAYKQPELLVMAAPEEPDQRRGCF